MAIKKYSRLISFLFFIEYGAFISVVASIFFKVGPKDEYAELAKRIGAGLLLHAFLCLVMAAITGTMLRKHLKLDMVSSTLRAMLGALATLPLALLVAAALLLLPAFFSLSGSAERVCQVMAVPGYFVALVLPYFLILRRLQKKPSITPE